MTAQQETKPRTTSELYELLMLGLCVYVLVALAATTFMQFSQPVIDVLDMIDTAVCCVFMGDFFYRLHKAEDKWAYLKWGWIDFLASIPAVGPLRWGQFGRLIRILRLLRGLRSCKMLIEMLLRRRNESAFGTVMLIAMLLVVFSSVAILTFERGVDGANIQTSEDALWWACATVTGVGYGDLFPVTSSGRAVAVFTMTSGLALFGVFAGFVASWFLAPQEAEQDQELQDIRERLTVIETHLGKLVELRLAESEVEHREREASPLDYSETLVDRLIEETAL